MGEIRDVGLAVKDSPQYFLDVEVFAGFLADILVEPDLVRMLDQVIDGEMLFKKLVALLFQLELFGEPAENVDDRIIRAGVFEPCLYKLHDLALFLFGRLL